MKKRIFHSALLALLLAGCGTEIGTKRHLEQGGSVKVQGLSSSDLSSLFGENPRFGRLVDRNGVSRLLDYDCKRGAAIQAIRDYDSFSSVEDSVPVTLLPRVDLRNKCSVIGDQGALGSCTAWAISGFREFLELKNHEKFTQVSPLYLYFQLRKKLGEIYFDRGSIINDGMDIMEKVGICPEKYWPYDPTRFEIAPPPIADANAGYYKIELPRPLAGRNVVKTMKYELSKGNPVVFGFKVYENFYKIGADGMMPFPTPNDPYLGGHAVMTVGYDEDRRVFIVRNSWSEAWGDRGYFYMPFDYISNNAFDFWTAAR